METSRANVCKHKHVFKLVFTENSQIHVFTHRDVLDTGLTRAPLIQ